MGGLLRGRAAVVLRERQAQQPLFGELAPQPFAPACLLGHVLLALVEIVGVAQQPLDAFLEKPLLLRQIKIHVVYSFRIGNRFTSFRMRHLAQSRNPYSRLWLWIPGSFASLAP